MRRRRRPGNTTPPNNKNKSVENLVVSKGNGYPVTDLTRMMVIMTNEINEELKEVLKEYIKMSSKSN
jgi:hypothetical protein